MILTGSPEAPCLLPEAVGTWNDLFTPVDLQTPVTGATGASMDEELTSGGGASLPLVTLKTCFFNSTALGHHDKWSREKSGFLGEPLGNEQRGPRGLTKNSSMP